VRSIHSIVRAVLVIALVTAGAAGCKKKENQSAGGGSGSQTAMQTGSGSAAAQTGGGGGAGRIALLLPESQTARYEAADRPFFEAKFKELCPNVEIDYSNANQVAADQQQQAEAAIVKGVKVMVLDPVDGDSAGVIAKNAKTKNIPVVSYDRLIKGGSSPDYYISFDNEKVGQLQAEALLKKLTADGKAKPKITMINGSPTDNNASLFKKGAHSVFDGKVEIVKEGDAANWKPEEAQQLMEQFITAIGKNGFDGAYQANDGCAGGAIAAMKRNGVDPKKKPTTGQDAELAAVQRILAGEQYMTVYKAIQPEAEKAAELACALYKGQQPAAGMVTSKVNNGTIDVPSILLTPIAVTADGAAGTSSVADTIVKDKFFGADTVAQICKGYEAACKTAKLQ
jgi:D-xylose transport system substrate-binding protein